MTVSDCTSHAHSVYPVSTTSIEQRLAEAAAYCQAQNVRFTVLRRQILALILQAQAPLGAYDLLALLNQPSNDTNTDDRQYQSQQSLSKSSNKPAAPPTVYRSLDFLLAHGFIHRLASSNQFVPCCHPRHKHNAAFLVCQSCQDVQEFSGEQVSALLDTIQLQTQFTAQQTVLEVSGCCADCQSVGKN